MTTLASLKRPLIVLPLVFNFLTLLISFAIILAVAMRLDSGGRDTDQQITLIIAGAINRQNDGSLAVQMTPELAELRAKSQDFWFVVEDDEGRSASLGRVPRHFASLIGKLPDLSYAQFRDRHAPYDLAAVIRQEVASAGTLTILGHGKLTEPGFLVTLASSVALAPIFLLLVLTSLLYTPWIVRRSLAGVSRIAQEAQQIDTNHRGRRLSEEHVPIEIAPLVRAVNETLRRLDEGYDRQQRFIASAAHELRTPIAILRAKIDEASDPGMRSLGTDVQRLATLAEQLLDLQRLDNCRGDDDLDLIALVRRVVGDLAPLLIASDRTIEVVIDHTQACRGDAAAMERVLMNLIQNAVEHGGRNVIVRIIGSVFEVEDDGPGIPPEEREHVFEAFHRLRPRPTGSGLGLNLVQQVVDAHGGRVAVFAALRGGTIVRVELPSG